MRIGQSKRWSMIETWINIFIGYTINFFVQLLIYPLFGITIPLSTNLIIGLIFTVISVIRGYYVRRMFNWMHLRWE